MSAAGLRFGFIGWETTHTHAWVKIVQREGGVATLFDDGSMCTEEDTIAYCAAHDVRHCATLDELAEASDIVAIMTCDWDRHVAWAAPMVRAGKTVYIDKPVACGDADLAQLCDWKGAPLVLGSCNRYEPGILSCRGIKNVDRLAVFTSQQGEFYYPIHAVEVGQTMLGRGARRVRWKETETPAFEIEHEHCAKWEVGWARSAPGFVIELCCGNEERTWTFTPGGTLQDRLVSEVVNVHRGISPLVSIEEAVEAVRILRAAYTSKSRGAAWVNCSESGLAVFSGAEFAQNYRRILPRPNLFKI